jgi:RNA polymerase sigma-70 factor (ECF subfamily)
VNFNLTRRDEFERVAMPHIESLLRAAVRIASDRTTAEDMVQETFLRAWQSFDQFERGTNCKAWLFRIMLNVSNKSQRRSYARPVLVPIDDHENGNVISLHARPLQLESVEVLSALDSLSAEHRLVLMLAAVEGFTCKEISGICSIPIGTVMSRLSRARAELRKLLVHSQPEQKTRGRVIRLANVVE